MPEEFELASAFNQHDASKAIFSFKNTGDLNTA